ncbi:MAG: hypothetical protein HPY71_06050 [Firmicutes bacterium]|nr:hypothetical protein [Bacillota bacterium]
MGRYRLVLFNMLFALAIPALAVLLPGVSVCTQASVAEAAQAAGAAVEVTVEGVGTIVGEDVGRARDEALRDAYRLAIEQGAGVSIASRTDMRDFKVFYDRVVSQAGGYVQSYQILGEPWQTPDGLVHVRIRARVVRGDIRNDLDGLAMLIDMMGNPVIMVMIDELNLDRKQPSSQAESEIIRQLTAVRYHLVDPRQVEAIKASDTAKRAMSGDISAAVTLGERFAADIVITGTVYSKYLTSTRSGNFTFHSCKAFSDIRVVLTQTAQLLMSSNIDDTQADLSPEAAGIKAIKSLAAKVASQLVWDIPKAVGGTGGVARTIQIIINGCNYTQMNQIMRALSDMRGVTGVNRRTFENNIAVIDIQTTGNVDDLAARLDVMQNPRLEVVMVTRDKLEVKVR